MEGAGDMAGRNPAETVEVFGGALCNPRGRSVRIDESSDLSSGEQHLLLRLHQSSLANPTCNRTSATKSDMKRVAFIFGTRPEAIILCAG